jgi:hypothetical protein
MSFARIRASGYTSVNLGVVVTGLRRGKSDLTCEPVEPDPVNSGVGSGKSNAFSRGN